MRLPESLLHRLILAGMTIPGLSAAPLMAQTTALDAFVLGTIYLGEDEGGQGGTTAKVTGEEARKAGRATLNDTLATLPGVSSINTSGGSRNEPMVFVRGFGRWHVPLSIDGIRVFLPADNRLDYGRFLTPDLAEIQVQKGYVSVLNGPGGMGGAINLVTKKPTEAFEGEARLGIEAGNRGDISGRSGYLSFGTKQEKWYAQASLMRRETDGFWLSKDFVPVPNEDGGLRDNADTSDSRVNLKFGYTPNATDEYVLSYTRQTGSKNAPYSTRQPMRGISCTTCVGGTQRDWTWPEWDISSLALYTHTDLGGSYVKTKVYYNTFDNTLSAWDSPAHTTQLTDAPRIFDSVYDDHSVGASAEYGLTLGAHELKFAVHFRRDVHLGTDYPVPGLALDPKPTERNESETLSFVVEDSWQVSDDLRVVGGFSFNKSKVVEALRTITPSGVAPSAPPAYSQVSYPQVSSEALDWQLATIWTPDAGGAFHASVSSRTSFPTMFHRYSTRFGLMEPNPDLEAERATNIELGYSGDLGSVRVEGAVFYSRVADLIQSVVYDASTNPATLQQQNVGKGVYKGVEIAASWAMNDRVGLSANYTYIDASIEDPAITGLRITDIPQHKVYLALDWQATDTLIVTPSVEIYGSRWSDPAAGQPGGASPAYAYTRMPGFAVANFSASWQVSEKAAVDFGIRNLFDRNVQLVEGYPEAGRSFFLTSQIRF